MLVRVCGSAELQDAQMRPVSIHGEEIALFRIDGQVHAIGNVCTHGYALLTDGYFDGKCVECPLHQGLFDVTTGEAVDGPAQDPVRTFTAREQDGAIFIDLEA
jgi:nitrite reductase/ring-hydroxylating ferredoxin subunit